MTARRALVAGLAFAAATAAVGSAFSHSGGSIGYASIAIGRASIRYSLTLWPSALPPAVAEELRLARAGRAPSRDRLLGFIHDKVTLVAQGRRCEAGPGFLLPPAPHPESVTVVVDFACADAVRDLLIRDDLFDVLGADYHTLAKIEAPGVTQQFTFTPDTRETRVALAGAGQALVVAVALPLLVVLRHTRWEKRMVLSSSLAILVVGLVLFVERALL